MSALSCSAHHVSARGRETSDPHTENAYNPGMGIRAAPFCRGPSALQAGGWSQTVPGRGRPHCRTPTQEARPLTGGDPRPALICKVCLQTGRLRAWRRCQLLTPRNQRREPQRGAGLRSRQPGPQELGGAACTGPGGRHVPAATLLGSGAGTLSATWLPTCGPLPTLSGSPGRVLPTEPSFLRTPRPHPARSSPLATLPSSSANPPFAQPLRLRSPGPLHLYGPSGARLTVTGVSMPPPLPEDHLSVLWPPAPLHTSVFPCSRNNVQTPANYTSPPTSRLREGRPQTALLRQQADPRAQDPPPPTVQPSPAQRSHPGPACCRLLVDDRFAPTLPPCPLTCRAASPASPRKKTIPQTTLLSTSQQLRPPSREAMRFQASLLGTWKAGGLPSLQVTGSPETLCPRAPGLTRSRRATDRGLGNLQRTDPGSRLEGAVGQRARERRRACAGQRAARPSRAS